MTFSVFSQHNNSTVPVVTKVSVNDPRGKGNAFQDVTNRNANVQQTKTLGKKRKFVPTAKIRPSRAPVPSTSSGTLQQRKVMNPFEAVIPNTVVPKNPFDLVDIDKKDRSDPLAVTEYADSIYQMLREKERRLPDPMVNQPHINSPMLPMLVDWLVLLHEQFETPNCLHLTVNLITRFVSQVPVSRDKLQLVGVAAYFIAAKYEEIWVPSLAELECTCADLYSQESIVHMETEILKILHYNVSGVTAPPFLVRYLKAAAADGNSKVATIANYVLDSTLLHSNLLQQHLPSELAAASVIVAKKAVYPQRDPWSLAFEFETNYSKSHVLSVAQDLCHFLDSTPSNLLSLDTRYGLSWLTVSREILDLTS